MNNFRNVCTITANLNNLSGALEPNTGVHGRMYWSLDFDVCIRFGGTEWQAYLKWTEDVSGLLYARACMAYCNILAGGCSDWPSVSGSLRHDMIDLNTEVPLCYHGGHREICVNERICLHPSTQTACASPDHPPFPSSGVCLLCLYL